MRRLSQLLHPLVLVINLGVTKKHDMGAFNRAKSALEITQV